MKFEQLKKHLSNGEPFAAYTVTGNDRYLLGYTKRLFTDKVQLPDLNVNHFGADADVLSILNACQTVPMMTDKRIVIYESFKSVDSRIAEYLKHPSKDTVLLLFPAVPPSKCGLDKTTEIIDCNHLDRALLRGWIEKESQSCFETDAKEILIDYTMSDLTRISTEVTKLKGYAGDRKVTVSDVMKMVSQDSEFKMYQFSQALGDGHADSVYAMAETLLKEADPLVLLKVISTHYHKLFHVRISRTSEAEIASSFGVKTFALSHLRTQAKKYSPVKLKKILDYLADSDYRIKTGQINSAIALENVILTILSIQAA